MTIQNPASISVKQAIESLIQAGTHFDIQALDEIYHEDLQIIMLDEDGKTVASDKNTFKKLFKTKLDRGDPPLDTWSEFHHINASENSAHVLISRKVQLLDEDQKLLLSIDLVKQNDRWQVIREVIFVQAHEA